MNEPVLHILVVSPAVILDDLLQGRIAGAPAGLNSLPYVTFEEFLSGTWLDKGSVATAYCTDQLSSFKFSLVRTFEASGLTARVVSRFRYVSFVHVIEQTEQVVKEHFETSKFIDEYHPEYTGKLNQDVVQIPDFEGLDTREWNECNEML